MKITHKIAHKILTIFIDGLPHCQFDRTTIDSWQSWSYFNGVWTIEINFKSGSILLLEYDNVKKWKSVLEIIGKNLFVY